MPHQKALALFLSVAVVGAQTVPAWAATRDRKPVYRTPEEPSEPPGGGGGSPPANPPPAPITDLTTLNPTLNSVQLRWTEQSEDGGPTGTQKVSRYLARYSTLPITAANFDVATDINTNSWTPLNPGATHTETVAGLPSAPALYFAVKSFDAYSQISGVSNSPVARTSADPAVAAVLTPAPGQLLNTIEGQQTGDVQGGAAPSGSLQAALGQWALSAMDLVIPGRGLDFRFERAYRSRITYNGPLGRNWDHNYNLRLMAEVDGSGNPTGHIFVAGLGRQDRYVSAGGGVFISPPGLYNKLTQNPDGTFLLREASGLKCRFTAIDSRSRRAFLVSITDRNQNQFTCAYDTLDRLSQVTDTLGRAIQYVYTSGSRLDHITDFAGRTVRFQYDANNDLIAVTSPAVTGTPNGNDFPDGKTTKYTYASGFADANLNHNLLTITRPNETALEPDGPPAVINTYGTDPTRPYELDKLLTQTVGGLNAAASARGLPAAGGKVIFYYLELNPGGDPLNLLLARNRTTVIDRNGNVTEYEQNVLGAHLSIKEYTGRVDTTLSRSALEALIPSNNASFPPIAKLRTTDPAFFETLCAYNVDGQQTSMTYPELNTVVRTFDTANPDRFQQENLLEVRRTAGPRGGDGAGSAINDIVTKYVYEPIFNQLRFVSDPRGLDPDFIPPVNPSDAGVTGIDFDNDDTITSQEIRRSRYTTLYVYDYQEGEPDAILALAVAEGVPLTLTQATRLSFFGNDLNEDGLIDQQQGNRIGWQAPLVFLAAGGTQIIGGRSAYNSRGQLLFQIDPDVSRDAYLYYPQGNPSGVGGIPPDANLPDELGGYLGRMVRDTTADDNSDGVALNITTNYRYDSVGNLINVTDGRGVRTDYAVNQLNQVVRITRAADVSASPEIGLVPFAYTVTNSYDANNNVVQVDVQNKDGDTDSNPILTTTHLYDILDDQIETAQEVSPVKTLTTGYRYDANENAIRTIQPVGNFHETVYDERDLVFTAIGGADDPAIASTIQDTYDRNRNRSSVLDAEDTDGVGGAEAVLNTYDGFERLVHTLDPVGNERLVTYDPASNQLTTKARGRIAGASPTSNATASNVDLSRSAFQYDEVNRRFRTDDDWFIPAGVTPTRTPIPVADGLQTTTVEYDAQSRVTRLVNDNNHATTSAYDGIDRLIRRADALQNELLYAYDANDNFIQATEQERRGDDLAAPAEIFTARHRYDTLNRPILTVDNLNQARRFAYDSRGNVTQMSDAQGPVDLTDPQFGLINRSGNTVRYFYDGLSRRTKAVKDLRLGGAGDGTPSLNGPADPNLDPTNLDISNPANPDGKITETSAWDDNSRLQSVADDNGNTTIYLYDSLNRKIQETFADGTTRQYVYDRDHNLRQATDQNGSVFTHAYDAVNLLKQTTIARAPGVLGTTTRSFQYDGLSRQTFAFDNNSPTVGLGDDSHVLSLYDSLSRKIQERQILGFPPLNRVITNDFDGLGNRVQLTYPNNRQVSAEFDAVERLNILNDLRIGEPNNIVDYSYIGPGRVLERTFLNGTKLTYLDNAGVDVGYDGIKRTIRHRHETSLDATIADFTHGYNREHMRLFERRLHQPAGHGDVKGEGYDYDSFYRLTNFAVGAQTATGIIAIPDTQTLYNLDGVGNRTFINQDAVVTNYTPNNMNEYDDVGGTAQVHDANGNLKDDDALLYAYDACNRLVEVRRKSDNALIATYAYDDSNRRISKIVTNSGALDGTTRFLWDGWQEIEERDGSDVTVAQYTCDSCVGGLLTMERGGQTYYYHDDSLGSVEALTDSAGAIVERTTYDAYGAPQFTDAAFTPTGTTSSVGNPFLYTGQRLDPETGLYYFRNRYYDPKTGRFIERDPIGYAGGSLGLYEYVGNNPTNATDPSGLYEEDFHYYAVYYFARKAGFSAATAFLIASSSQYVDEHSQTEPAQLLDRSVGCAAGCMATAFLGVSGAIVFPPDYKADQPMFVSDLVTTSHFPLSPDSGVVEPDNAAANARIVKALKDIRDSHKDSRKIINLGIGLHTLMDSYSHEGFDETGHYPVPDLPVEFDVTIPEIHVSLKSVDNPSACEESREKAFRAATRLLEVLGEAVDTCGGESKSLTEDDVKEVLNEIYGKKWSTSWRSDRWWRRLKKEFPKDPPEYLDWERAKPKYEEGYLQGFEAEIKWWPR
ncbi:MAG: hypothetical protein HY597_03335 [Candidatus Omnitrophica bacterium]|nr:hypothetical protein [Candidatus Omnitrophota bacterium]